MWTASIVVGDCPASKPSAQTTTTAEDIWLCNNAQSYSSDVGTTVNEWQGVSQK